MVHSNFPPGRLALDRYDFNKHLDGSDFRQNSDTIDINPVVFINGNPYSNISEAFEALDAGFSGINQQTFITIGDGYGTYENILTDPDNPYDSSVPALDGYLNLLLNPTDPLNPEIPAFNRIKDGGVVLIKAGTYKFEGTVEIPAGITIIGEGFGTKIINQISSPAPLFKAKADLSRTIDAGIDSSTKFMFAKNVVIANMIIADNFVVPKFLGDLSYKTPQNDDSISPLVAVEQGGSLIVENVKFVGKTTYSGPVVSAVTSYAIRTDNTIPLTTGTVIDVHNCFIDGFSVALRADGYGGTNDYISFNNNLVRTYGYLSNDFTLPGNNCGLRLNGCNIDVSDNYYFAYDSTITSFIFIDALVSGSVNMQSRSKITVTDNNLATDKSNNSSVSLSSLVFNVALGDVTTKIRYFTSNNTGNEPTVNYTSDSSINLFSETGAVSLIGDDNASISIQGESVDISSGSGGGDIDISAPTDDINLSSGNAITISTTDLSISSTDITIDAATNLNLAGSAVKIDGVVTGNSSSTETLRFGFTSVAVTSSNVTLISSQYNTQAIEITGTLTGNRNVILPAVSGYSKLIINNGTDNQYRITVKTLSGNGVVIPPGASQWIYCDGTNINSGSFKQRETPIDGYTSFLYRCNEASGSLINSGAYGVDAYSTLVAASSPTYQNSGPFGNSIETNSTSDIYTGDEFVSLPFDGYSVSISCWFNPSRDNTGTRRDIFGVWDDTGSTANLVLLLNSGDRPVAQIYVGSSQVAIAPSDTFIPVFGVWYLYSATYDGSLLKLYVNGNLVTTTSTSSSITGTAPYKIYLGNNAPINGPALGYITDCRIDSGIVRSQNYYKDMYNRMNLFNS